jgi:cholinesterase
MGGATPAIDLALNNGFRCGAAAAAKTRLLHHIPVWRYHLALTNPNSTMGALHGQDIPLVFNGADGLGKVMQTAWGNFAKDPERALDKLGWPRYNPTGELCDVHSR